MDRFNSKLYEKYRNLKKKKFSEIEESNQKLVSDVLRYQSVTENLIIDLKNENDKLREVIVSIQEQYQNCQKQLLEENQKSKLLSIEFGTLKELLSQKEGNIDRTYVRVEEESECLLKNNTLQSKDQYDNNAVDMMESHKDDMLVPSCCRRTKTDFGDGTGKRCNQCAFHALVELLVGMKFSVECDSEGLCVTVIHQMSGYRFTLSWVRDKDDEEELVYRVSSLGTIEGVAKQWMKEDIVFSLAMCPVFFDRLSKVFRFNS